MSRLLIAMLLALAVAAGCREPESVVGGADRTSVNNNSAEATPAPVAVKPWVAEPIPAEAVEDVRWLFVEAIGKASEGGWASGSFDEERNRLSIRTRDVTRFVVDTGKIPIDWSRLVVLSIDGRTSELRRRDLARLVFALDRHGQWVVEEKP